MRKFTNLLKKELSELLTLRVLAPYVILVGIMFLVGHLTTSETKRSNVPLIVGLADLDSTPSSKDLKAVLEKNDYVVLPLVGARPDSLVKEAVRGKATVLVIIPHGFEQALRERQGTVVELYSILKTFGFMESVKKAEVKNILTVMNRKLSDDYLRELAPGLDPATVKAPITPQEYVVFKGRISRGNMEEVLGLMMGQTIMVPIALLIMILSTGTMLASSIGQEKENKTLETLLTVPVARLSIVAAKMLAPLILALIIAGFFMVSMGSYMFSLGAISSSNPVAGIVSQGMNGELGIGLDIRSDVLLMLSIFLSIVAALSLSTLLALFSRDAKDAQATVTPLMILVMLPYFFSVIFDPLAISLPLKIFIFLIPFSHAFFAFKFLLLGEVMPVVLGIAYQAVFSLVLLFFASRLFTSDRLLTMSFGWLSWRRKGRLST